MQIRSEATRWFAYCSLLLIWLLLFPSAGFAAADDDTIAALQAQLAALTARLEALEARRPVPVQDYQAPAVQPATPSNPSWTDRVRLKGDFRYRHETIDAEFADSTRNRNRVRARPAIIAEVSDAVEVGFGLATGGDNPVSSNQTLGDVYSTKPVNLDLAYFRWSAPVDGLRLTGGKFKNPLHRTGGNALLWDNDLRPEGLAATYQAGGLNLVGIFNWVTESSGSDNLMFGGQASWTTPLGPRNKLLVGAGYYDLSSVQGRAVPFDGRPRGNSVDALNRYLYGYRELEVYSEFSFHLGQVPARLFANYVENLDAPEFDRGWALGAVLDGRGGKHPWRLSYAYQDLEADAVYAFFTDSDFIGGGTDGRGHIFRGSYALSKRISVGSLLFINERGENQTGVAEGYNRLMLDLQFRY